MDLTSFKLTVKEKEYCQTEGLCFYYGQAGYQTFFCFIKLANKYVETILDIQDTSAVQPTSDTFQDLRKK